MDVVVDHKEEDQGSFPTWVYGAVGGGVVLIGVTATVLGNWAWRRSRLRETAKLNLLHRQEALDNLTPRENTVETKK